MDDNFVRKLGALGYPLFENEGKQDVNKTLAVATNPPTETICTPNELPVTPIAVLKGVLEFPSATGANNPTATKPTET